MTACLYPKAFFSSVVVSPYRRRDYGGSQDFPFLDLREGSSVRIPTNTAASRKLPASVHPKARRITRPVDGLPSRLGVKCVIGARRRRGRSVSIGGTRRTPCGVQHAKHRSATLNQHEPGKRGLGCLRRGTLIGERQTDDRWPRRQPIT